MTTPATTVAGRQKVWTRDRIIQSLREYARVYGPDFTTAAFNPSTAKWRDDPTSRERYLLGNPLRDGEPWPALNTIRKAFGGFNAAREAAGLAPNTPGPSKGRPQRAHHKHAPIRDVHDPVRVVIREVEPSPATSPADAAALARAKRGAAVAERKVGKAERQLEKVNERLSATRARAREAADGARRQRERAVRASDTAAALREELHDVQATLALETARAERAENELRVQMPELARVSRELHDTREELTDVQELRALADPEELEAARAEVRVARQRVADAREAEAAAERRAQAAEAAARRSEAERRDHQRKAQTEATERRKIQLAVAGHDRKLTPEELRDLRGNGPAGAAVFAAAIRDVARAQAKAQREPLKAALRRAAEAAIRWMDRL